MKNVVEVAFKTRVGIISRLITSDTPLTVSQIKKFYNKFYRFNNCEFCTVFNGGNKELANKLDYYIPNEDYYSSKAIRYAKTYGIKTYKVKNNLMVYNKNYHNQEYINGEWVDKPYTYQATVILDEGTETLKRLQRLQKDGWDNV